MQGLGDINNLMTEVNSYIDSMEPGARFRFIDLMRSGSLDCTKMVDYIQQKITAGADVKDAVLYGVTELFLQGNTMGPIIHLVNMDNLYSIEGTKAIQFDITSLFSFTFNDKKYILPKAIKDAMLLFSPIADLDLTHSTSDDTHKELFDTLDGAKEFVFKYVGKVDEQVLNALFQLAMGCNEEIVSQYLKTFNDVVDCVKLMQYLSFDIKLITNVCQLALKIFSYSDFIEAYSQYDCDPSWLIAISHFKSGIYKKIFDEKHYELFVSNEYASNVLEKIILRFLDAKEFDTTKIHTVNLEGIYKFFLGDQVTLVQNYKDSVYLGSKQYTSKHKGNCMAAVVVSIIDVIISEDHSDKDNIEILDVKKFDTTKILAVDLEGITNSFLVIK